MDGDIGEPRVSKSQYFDEIGSPSVHISGHNGSVRAKVSGTAILPCSLGMLGGEPNLCTRPSNLKDRTPSSIGPPVPPARCSRNHDGSSNWVAHDKVHGVQAPPPRQKAVRGACILERMNQLLSHRVTSEIGLKEAPCDERAGPTASSEPKEPAFKRRRLKAPSLSLPDSSVDLWTKLCSKEKEAYREGKPRKLEAGDKLTISEGALLTHAAGFTLSSSRADSRNWRYAQVMGLVYTNQSRDIHDYVLILAQDICEASESGESARGEIRQAENAEIVTVPSEVVQDESLCIFLGNLSTTLDGWRGHSDLEQREDLNEQAKLARYCDC